MAANDVQVVEGQQLTHQATSEPLLAASAAGTDPQPQQLPPQAAAALSAGPASSPAGTAQDADLIPQAPLAANHSATADLPQVNGYADSGGHASGSEHPAGYAAGGPASGDNHSSESICTMMMPCPGRSTGMQTIRDSRPSMPAGGVHDLEPGPVAVAMEVVEGTTGMTLPLKIKLKLHSREDMQ